MNKQQKEKQKELKEIYTECLKDVWGNDNKMIEYCLKETSYIVELSDGNIIALEKPHIKKDFCLSLVFVTVTSKDVSYVYPLFVTLNSPNSTSKPAVSSIESIL